MTSDVSKHVAQLTLWRRIYFPSHSAKSVFEIRGFNIFMLSLAPKGKGKRKIPQTGLYKNEYNCLSHMLCRPGIEPSVLRRSVCVVQHKRVDIVLIIN